MRAPCRSTPAPRSSRSAAPIALPLNREALGGPLRLFFPHNIREGLHALYALIRYRQSDQRAAVGRGRGGGHRPLLGRAQRLGWAASRPAGVEVLRDQRAVYGGVARAIGPLVKIYRATGYGPTLALALRLKDKVLNEHLLRRRL